MLSKNYPLHDINVVFDMFEETIKRGGVADNTGDELTFLNKLFAAMPPQATEYAMQMLHGTKGKDLPREAQEIMPLYIRFLNLAEYLERVDFLRVVPENPSMDEIMERHKMMDSLGEYEKAFCMEILGFKFNSNDSELEKAPEVSTEENKEEESGSALHLMNAAAPVWPCTDPVKTALFYEKNLGFKATHLSDEKMPHIRLTRDNIAIALVESPVRIGSVAMYEFIIYASEPMLLYHELKTNGVEIVEDLPDANESQKASSNRQFVIKDCDGRKICVSQSTEIM